MGISICWYRAGSQSEIGTDSDWQAFTDSELKAFKSRRAKLQGRSDEFKIEGMEGGKMESERGGEGEEGGRGRVFYAGATEGDVKRRRVGALN